jgi:hypothetical protein
MKRLTLMAMFLTIVILNGCIVSTSPPNFIITMDKGDTLEFKTTVFPASSTAEWTLYYGGVEDTATGLDYTFTPDKVGAYQMKLEVTDPRGSSQNRTWIIYVQ